MDWSTELRRQCPELEIRMEEPMARHVSMRVGGPAMAMAFPKSEAELAALLRFCQNTGISPVIFGAGTNLLPPDAGLHTLAVCLLGGLVSLRTLPDNRLEAGAGVTLAKLSSFAAERGLSGLEFAHGIPGTVGGGLYMNAGAYGGELAQFAVETRALTSSGSVCILSGEQQGFGYRTSAFQTMDVVIISAVFQLSPDEPASIRERMGALMERRRASQPLNLPSSGSTFKRPAQGYAAALIQEAGLKGFRVGGASVSEKHAGFVVNDHGASCADVLKLIRTVRERVYANSGVLLEPEVRILQENGEVDSCSF